MKQEEINKIEVKETTEVKETKKQKISTSYTIKAFANNINKMQEAKLITKEEQQQLLELHNTIVHRWIGLEFKL